MSEIKAVVDAIPRTLRRSPQRYHDLPKMSCVRRFHGLDVGSSIDRIDA
jgi:hypothetical protein